jgi:hypothetical protein
MLYNKTQGNSKNLTCITITLSAIVLLVSISVFSSLYIKKASSLLDVDSAKSGFSSGTPFITDKSKGTVFLLMFSDDKIDMATSDSSSSFITPLFNTDNLQGQGNGTRASTNDPMSKGSNAYWSLISVNGQQQQQQHSKPPIAIDQSVSTELNKPIDITLQASDMNPTANLQASIVVQSLHGNTSSIDQNTGKLTYTPQPGFKGEDFFRFKVKDGTLDSNVATVKISIS